LGRRHATAVRTIVLDFTALLPGPLATLMLAGQRRVIEIRRPGGENMRHYEPRFAAARCSRCSTAARSLV
jgi:crotonobetainyl-CoA:carnitine CoA-transferase CaiB-like acyl-CoA transferase